MATRREMLKAELLKEFEGYSTEQLKEICAFTNAYKAGEVEMTEAGFRRFHEEYQNRRVQK